MEPPTDPEHPMTLTAIITARDLDSCVPVRGAVDATLYDGDEPIGEAVLVLDHTGHLQPYGDSLDTWADGDLLAWLDAQDDRSDAISEIVGAAREAAGQ